MENAEASELQQDAPAALPAYLQESVGTLVNRRTVLGMPGRLDHETAAAAAAAAKAGPEAADGELPKHSVRLLPLLDHDLNRPSATKTMVRTLRGDGVIRLGRQDAAMQGEPKPIVYSSKVVSRAHAEIILDNGQWYARDVGSSSGTWLNSQRLGNPSTVSERRPLRSGDVLQFGVNFRGGSEPQFRAIKVRVEIDGGADRKPSPFHTTQYDNLRMHVMQTDSPLQDCIICLQKISPMEALFVSPCAHVWHYRCIRAMLIQKYPFFECPMCRDTFDLEEAEVSGEEEDEIDYDK